MAFKQTTTNRACVRGCQVQHQVSAVCLTCGQVSRGVGGGRRRYGLAGVDRGQPLLLWPREHLIAPHAALQRWGAVACPHLLQALAARACTQAYFEQAGQCKGRTESLKGPLMCVRAWASPETEENDQAMQRLDMTAATLAASPPAMH